MASSIHTNTLSSFPWCAKCGYSHPQQMPGSGTSLLYLQQSQSLHNLYFNARRPRDCPTTTEAQRDMADHPGITDQGATQTTGKDPANPPADAHATATPTCSTSCSTSHSASPNSLTDPIICIPPSDTTRAERKSFQLHPQWTASRPLPT